jgi:Kdo2-lipid IVA lauroyltransferase/acyltransferase
MELDTATKRRPAARRRSRTRRMLDWVLAQAVFLLLRSVRLLPADRAIAFGGRLARLLSPFIPANRVGRENLRRAFPELSKAERGRILSAAWDNLGRTAVEYLFLDRIFDVAPGDERLPERIEVCGEELFHAIKESRRPAIIFSAHLANWELLAVCAAVYRLDLTVLFRPPNNASIAERLNEVRGAAMGPLVVSRVGASFELGAALERGGQVGLLVDQHYGRGTPTSFFGLAALTNPMLGILARRFDCPVYAARCIRLPGGRFRLELTGPIELPRDRSGAVDVAGAMQAVTAIVEGWVREHPEQWLWLHRRWRAEPARSTGVASPADS